MQVKEKSNILNLKKDEVKDFFETHKKDIERPVYAGIGEIVSGITLLLSVVSSDFDNNLIIPARYLDLFVVVLALVFIGVGVYQLIKNLKYRLTTETIVESLIEMDADRIHTVCILLLHNKTDGKYLLVKNGSWKCLLFPSYNINANFDKNAEKFEFDEKAEAEMAKTYFKKMTDVDPRGIQYVGAMDEKIRPCYATGTPYRYKFHFFLLEVDSSDTFLKKYNGNTYVWKSLEGMRKNKNIMKKNGDVVRFVADKDGIPFD